MTKEELRQFSEEIKGLFLEGKIKAPIHLSAGNEEPLINIFKEIRKQDWVLSTYRSHYHALLKGIDREWLTSEVLEGRSMHINNAEHKFITSSITGGCLPIALGLALAIKMQGEDSRVWCFVGDMASYMGVCDEVKRYAGNFNLPLVIVVEDNHFSVNTLTAEVWGISEKETPGGVIMYSYDRIYPHSGCGTRVKF